ncbi:SigE family RNA polymerase sigma factor [Fodinicola feengrottensis]|uniref:SigE family RNA polymerase sigma factor n=1 Tax=Fodinicola feengrottensis TaxID=435914 RepID=A0ABN2IJ09_9ACTN
MRDIASQLDRDEAFVEQVYRASAPGLVGAAYALTGDRAEAEDVVQEAFIRALAQPGKVAAADSPGAWMRVVALNIARSRFRRRQTHDRLVRQLPLADERLPEPGPDRVMLVAAIGQLPYEQREAVTLYYLADLSVGDIAESQLVSPNVVKSRLRRGRQALAESLAGERCLSAA